MFRIQIAAIAVVVLTSACTSVTETTTVPPEPLTDQLVVATTDGAVVVLDSDLAEVARFTPVEGSTFRQPTWLDRATVVFSELSDTRDYSLTAGDVESGTTKWRSKMTSSPFFFAPAPAGSAYETTSLRLNPGADLISELIDADGVATVLGTESPFYTSWAPDGGRIAINVPGRRVDIVTDGVAQTILDPSNGFQTPVWLDLGLLMLRDTEDGRRLTLWNDGAFDDVGELAGAAIFVAEGSMVAIRTLGVEEDPSGVAASLRVQQLPSLPSGRLVTVDLETRTFDTVTAEPTGVYQWDPTGTRLLYAEASFERGLTWFIWEDGVSEELVSYRPNRQWVSEFVAFFDQYAQSVQFWSPSGDRFAVPVSVGGELAVAVVPTDGSSPVLVPDAVWASWVAE